MTGEELRRLMKLRRLRTTPLAQALGIHPQTVRNLWKKDEVPQLYLMALTAYLWALGMDPIVVASRASARPTPPPRPRKSPGAPVAKPGPKPATDATTSDDLMIKTPEDLWSKLNS